MSAAMYTQEQMDIALLKQEQGNISQSIFGMDKRMDGIERKLDHLESEMKANFFWLLGLYGLGFMTLLGFMAHGFKWF